MIGQPELSRLAMAGGVRERAQEKDYVLAWLLAARATLGPSDWVFKGGTALRRCYFPDYRYSEDLDFTSDQAIDREGIMEVLDGWCEWIRDQAGIRVSLSLVQPGKGGTAFMTYVGPLAANDGRDLKVDVATNEAVREASLLKPLLAGYSDLDEAHYLIDVYSLVEIWAEKTRSLLQRSEPRDVYDLDRLREEDKTLPERAAELFRKKAEAKNLDPASLLPHLAERETKFEALWATRLASQVAGLEEFGGVWRRVFRAFRQAGY